MDSYTQTAVKPRLGVTRMELNRRKRNSRCPDDHANNVSYRGRFVLLR